MFFRIHVGFLSQITPSFFVFFVFAFGFDFMKTTYRPKPARAFWQQTTVLRFFLSAYLLFPLSWLFLFHVFIPFLLSPFLFCLSPPSLLQWPSPSHAGLQHRAPPHATPWAPPSHYVRPLSCCISPLARAQSVFPSLSASMSSPQSTRACVAVWTNPMAPQGHIFVQDDRTSLCFLRVQ